MAGDNQNERYYILLNASPGCSWDELRLAYKKQIQKWHPDRFKTDTEEKIAAEDKIKNINIAFNYFLKYYREHQKLPSISESRPRQNRARDERAKRNATGRSSSSSYRATASTGDRVQRNSRFTYLAALLTVVIIFTISLSENEDAQIQPVASPVTKNKENSREPVNEKYVANDMDNIERQEGLEQQQKFEHHFTIGSTIGDVILAQGQPTRIENETWYYGNAKVFFKDGTVSGWKRDPDTPLNIELNVE